MLIFGAASLLGWSLVRLQRPGTVPLCEPPTRLAPCASWTRVCIDDSDAVRAVIDRFKPDLIIHCGGTRDVGTCERQPDIAWRHNVVSVALLLDHLPATTRLVYCSSDHVFGSGRGLYHEDAETRPNSHFGHTQVAAEELIRAARPDALIIRSGPAIGPSLDGRGGHLDWLRYRRRCGLPMTMVADEIRSAVWADD
ncbi:MAG: sugar nucleotide-binding protein, partial [Myxococcota bacterium]